MDAINLNRDWPAFPTDSKVIDCPGLSKREIMAAMAMQGYIASFAGASADPKPENVAKKAVEYADALLAELEK